MIVTCRRSLITLFKLGAQCPWSSHFWNLWAPPSVCPGWSLAVTPDNTNTESWPSQCHGVTREPGRWGLQPPLLASLATRWQESESTAKHSVDLRRRPRSLPSSLELRAHSCLLSLWEVTPCCVRRNLGGASRLPGVTRTREA